MHSFLYNTPTQRSGDTTIPNNRINIVNNLITIYCQLLIRPLDTANTLNMKLLATLLGWARVEAISAYGVGDNIGILPEIR